MVSQKLAVESNKALHVSAGVRFSEASEACFCKRKEKETRKVAKQPEGFFLRDKSFFSKTGKKKDRK
jgi:hypothetical protein